MKEACAVRPCWTTDFMVRNSCVASSCAKAPRRSAVTVSDAPVVRALAAVYCCCCQSNKNACAVGSAEGSEPKPVARPITSTPTATMATAAMRERFDRRIAGEDMRPVLAAVLGATCRAGRLPPGASRAGRGRGAVPFWSDGPPVDSGGRPFCPGTPPGGLGPSPGGLGVPSFRGGLTSCCPETPLSRGRGAKRPRGLAWPRRSLAGEDTIRLPVTFAVSGLGPFPWPHHV